MAKQSSKQKSVEASDAKELRGNLRKVFAKYSNGEEFTAENTRSFLKKIPGHIQLKNRDGEDVNMKDPNNFLEGIHQNMLRRDFDAISKIVRKELPKSKSDNAAKKERYRAEAKAGKTKAPRHDGGMA